MTRKEAKKLLAGYGYYGRFSLRNWDFGYQQLTLKEWPRRGDWKAVRAVFKPYKVILAFEGEGIIGSVNGAPMYSLTEGLGEMLK